MCSDPGRLLLSGYNAVRFGPCGFVAFNPDIRGFGVMPIVERRLPLPPQHAQQLPPFAAAQSAVTLGDRLPGEHALHHRQHLS